MCWYYSKVPGQEFVDAVDRMIGDALQDMAQIEFRIKSVKLGSTEQCIDRRRTFAARVRTSEEIDDMTAMWSWRRQWLS